MTSAHLCNLLSERGGAIACRERDCVRNSYLSIVQTALVPVQRKSRPNETNRIGQLSPSSTGQLIESSTSPPGVNWCSATKRIPPLPIFTVRPTPEATTTPSSTSL